MTPLLILIGLVIVFWSQYRAIPHLHRLFLESEPSRLRKTILLAGLHWGLCGLGLLELLLFGFADPGLVRWMLHSGTVAVFFSVALVWTCFFAWSIAFRFHSQPIWVINLTVSAALLTVDYPILKGLQTGVWLFLPEHLLQFVINLLVFSTLLKITASTAGLSRVNIPPQQGVSLFPSASPVTVAVLACCMASLLFAQTAWAVAPLAVPDPQTSVQGLFSWFELPAGANHWPIAISSLLAAMFALWGFEVSRRLNVVVEDAFLWNVSDIPMPKSIRGELTNTRLIRSTLDITRIGVVFWRSPDYHLGVGSFDLRQGYTYVSAGFIHDKGLQCAGVFSSLPDFWKAAIHPDDLGVFEAVQIALHDPERNRFAHVVRIAAMDGSWLFVKGEAVVERDAKGRPLAFYGTHTDITDQINDNSRLSLSNQRKLFAMRMLGHDMQSNLSILSMSLDLMQRRLSSGDTGVASFENGILRMRQALGAAMTLVAETVALARSEDLTTKAKIEDLRASAYLRVLIDVQCERFRLPKHRVELECEPQLMLRGINTFALNSLLSNLVSNAIKYTPDTDAKVVVRLRAAGFPKGFRQSTPSVFQATLIEVEDEGIGIPIEFQSRLFTAFQRAANVDEIQGTGLGMVIVLSAAEALGAAVSFESTPERSKGTIFRVLLPNTLEQIRPSDVDTALSV